MIWVDRIANKIGNTVQHIDDMFTPSGYSHIGSLRGPILHDVVFRVFYQKNKDSVFTYVFNDFDPIDGLPPKLEKDFQRYMAYPLRLAPSPDKKYKNFAEFFAEDFKSVLTSLGVHAKFLSSWDLYHQGKFNEVIRIALDNKDKILGIYKQVAGYKEKPENWFPLQVICPQCQKLGTTKVIGWDGSMVTFECQKDLVTWAVGCGYKGKISPFDGNAKLPWKVDWPAHWKILGVTFEGAGKDHASRGGSYDIAFALCEKIFRYPKPYYFPYEFFLFGGKKMSSSKGIGLKARDLTTILPAEIARFLIVRLSPETTLEFNPQGDSIPNLFDDYDRCMNAYFDKRENKIPDGKPGEVLLEFARIMELSEVQPLPQKRLFLPRFRTVVNLLKSNVDVLSSFEKQKGGKLDGKEREILQERKIFAEIYLKTYSQKETQKDFKLSGNQIEFLRKLAQGFSQKKPKTRDAIQSVLFDALKQGNYKPREAFQAFYQVLTGQNFGPKAADLILDMGIDTVIKKLQKI